MAKALNKIFWGSLLVFFNFHINNFDILPNFIGYIFIYLGLTGLMSYSDQFSKAKTYVLVLAVVSIPLIHQFEANITEQIEMTTSTYILMAIYMIVVFVQLGFVYHFLRGLLDITQEAPFIPLEKKTDTLLLFYIILTLVTQIISLLILISHAFALSLAPIILVLAIVSFIVEIVLLVLIRQFRSKSLEQDMN